MKQSERSSLKKYTVIVIVFVISIMVIGVSVSYSFFNISVEGSKDVPPSNAAPFEVTTTLNDATAINAAQLVLIDGSTYEDNAEKVSFSVTNSSSSGVKAKYTIDLVEMSITKNLASKYFKWALVVNPEGDNRQVFTGDFADASIGAEGNSDTTLVEGLTKTLLSEEEALTLDIGATDNLDFYIWLENDDSVDQLYLTNGDFSGKLSMNAVPTR